MVLSLLVVGKNMTNCEATPLDSKDGSYEEIKDDKGQIVQVILRNTKGASARVSLLIEQTYFEISTIDLLYTLLFIIDHYMTNCFPIRFVVIVLLDMFLRVLKFNNKYIN